MTRTGRARRQRARGQSLVEFSISVPAFVMLLFGMLEFGFAFNHNMTLEYATREGARAGAALGPGTTNVPCAQVDNQIIAAVQRVLTSPGSPVDASEITTIRIYKATATGAELGSSTTNTWIPGVGPTVDGVPLKFKPTIVNWNACSRDNGSSPDQLGVSLDYRYTLISPLGILLGMTGTPSFQMLDRTVMALNPS